MKTLLNCCVAASLLFVALLVILHIVDPDVDPNWQPISEYSLGKAGLLMRLAFVAFGTSMVCLAVAIWRAVPRTGTRIAAAMLFLAALGNFLAAVFNTDPTGTPVDQLTTSGQIHAACAGLLAFFVLATPVVVWPFFKTSGLRQHAMRILAATIIVWIGEFVLVFAMAKYLSQTRGVIGPDTPIGWQGRFLLVACAAWLIVVGMEIKKSLQVESS